MLNVPPVIEMSFAAFSPSPCALMFMVPLFTTILSDEAIALLADSMSILASEIITDAFF